MSRSGQSPCSRAHPTLRNPRLANRVRLDSTDERHFFPSPARNRRSGCHNQIGPSAPEPLLGTPFRNMASPDFLGPSLNPFCLAALPLLSREGSRSLASRIACATVELSSAAPSSRCPSKYHVASAGRTLNGPCESGLGPLGGWCGLRWYF